MSRQQNIDLVNRYFQAMHDNDWATVEAMYHDDIVNHMAGTTPASGRIEGKAAMTDDLVAAQDAVRPPLEGDVRRRRTGGRDHGGRRPDPRRGSLRPDLL